MLDAPSQDSFHTWGRDPAGTGTYGYLDTATPGDITDLSGPYPPVMTLPGDTRQGVSGLTCDG